MTITHIIIISLIILMMFIGLILLINSFKPRNKAISHIDGIAEKNGLPILPRELREFDSEIPDNTATNLNSSNHLEDRFVDGDFDNQTITTSVDNMVKEPTTIYTDTRDINASTPESHKFSDSSQNTSLEDDFQIFEDQGFDIEIDLSEETTPVTPNNTFANNDAFSNLANATEQLLPKQTTFAQSPVRVNSPVLDSHLSMLHHSSNASPLNKTNDILEIRIVPKHSSVRIHGSNILQLVDRFGFKFSSMSFFHRYETKEGDGILWFSMTALGKDGFEPFDLNTLPSSQFDGLIFFLHLPHERLLQGYDSMMSIASLIARELDCQVIDEHGRMITRESKIELRTQLQTL